MCQAVLNMHVRVVNCSKDRFFLSSDLSMNNNRLIRIKMLVLYAGLHFQNHLTNTGNHIITLLSNNVLQILGSLLLISLALTITWLIQSRKGGSFRFSHSRCYHVSFYPPSHALFLTSFSILSSFFLSSTPMSQWPQVPAIANASCPQINTSMKT